ncbi:MAG: Fic family protein [Gemmatimonadales bacterium]
MSGKKESRTWQHNPSIAAPVSYRKACKYEIFIPDPIMPETLYIDSSTREAISEAERAVRALNYVAQPALKPLARLLLRTESIASSKVEGMHMSVRALAKAEALKETGGRKVGTEAAEILSNIDAMELAVEKAATAETLSVNEIEAIHRLLMEKTWNSHIAGRIRTEQNWIGGNDFNPCGADYVPPPPEYVRLLLQDLCNTMNNDMLQPIIQAALVHAQFETIHPFDDGNGRTGRALIQVVLRKRELAVSYVPPISVILARSKDRYISGLANFREPGGEVTWIKQFAEATTTAANLARSYLYAIQALVDDWRNKLRTGPNPRADSVAWKIIEVLPAHPMISGPVAEVAAGGSRPSVNIAIELLVNAGVLIPLTQGARNRTWEASGLLDILGRLEAGEIPEAL